MADNQQTEVDKYDGQHGRPEATPDMPQMGQDDLYGTRLNPVRETPSPFKNLQKVGG